MHLQVRGRNKGLNGLNVNKQMNADSDGQDLIDAESRPGKEGVRLVGAGAVSGGVNPVGPVRAQVRVPFVVPSVRRWARDGLGHGVVGKLGLEVQEDGVFFEESRLDKDAASAKSVGRHPCDICSATFPTKKALWSHERERHGLTHPVKRKIDGSGVCPCCKTSFLQRIRLRCSN